MANGRCRIHGGKSVGGYRGNPAAIVVSLQAIRRHQLVFKAIGLPWYGGRPRRSAALEREAAIMAAKAELEVLEERLPAVAVEEMTAPQLLQHGAVIGLRGLIVVADRPAPEDNPKMLGQYLFACATLARLYLHSADIGQRQQSDAALHGLIRELNETPSAGSSGDGGDEAK